MNAMAEQDELNALEGDWEIRCDAHSQSCSHEAVAFILFYAHGHEQSAPNPWWSACQTHVDAAVAGQTACSGCKRPLVIQQIKYL